METNDLLPPALDAAEIRVLGVLLEKSRLTPEYYPMTLNGLTIACNQKTSRDPVTDYDEETVLGTLDRLRDKRLIFRIDSAGSRVPKFRHSVRDIWSLDLPKEALFCVLLLRGSQTLGQLRQRCERMYPFDSLEEAQEALNELSRQDREPFALAKALPRRPGTKEIRFTHAWTEAGEEDYDYSAAPVLPTSSPLTDKVVELTDRVTSLEEELGALKAEFDRFKQAFE